MKTIWKSAVLFGLGALAASQASAAFDNLIVNGDFENGNTGFTSQYVYTSASGGLATGTGTVSPETAGSGKYAVGSDPHYFHSSFASFADHTPGAGTQMMVVNGSVVPGKTVWSGTVVPPLVIGSTYVFTAWAANVYPDNGADLRFTFGGNVLGDLVLTSGSTGQWTPFIKQFVATANQTSGMIDVNVLAQGNDFALDDISVTLLSPVPKTTTMIAGALLLLPFGASTFRVLRRDRQA